LTFIDACRKFIEIDSTPSSGTRELAEFADALARGMGFHSELQAASHGGLPQANVIVRFQASRPEQEFLLQAHLDTVESGPYALWTETASSPFNASIHQDRIYGLGTADTKLDFLCKLFAMKEIATDASRLKLPPVLVGTYGEELGMHGIVRLIRQKKISARQALVGEPTELGLVTAGKGYATVQIDIPFSDEEREFRREHDLAESTSTQSKMFLGKAAHSSNPSLGQNALTKLLDYLQKIPEGIAVMGIEGGVSANQVPANAVLEFDLAANLNDTIASKIRLIYQAVLAVEKEFAFFAEPAFSPPEPTLSLGMVRTMDDQIQLSGCCRLPPSVSTAVYERWMQKIDSACQLGGAKLHITDYKQPFRTDAEVGLIKTAQRVLQSMGRPSDTRAQSVTNEANVLTRLGIDCVVFGPGLGVGNSHAPNESVKISELNDATRFYTEMMRSLCF
jgi:acetylornithine deacetylase/succinyl-diaminopimelate desuccinylase-like protein